MHGTGFVNLYRVLIMDDLVSEDGMIFAASGVTDGVLLRGVRYLGNFRAKTHSVVMRSRTGRIRFTEAIHGLAGKSM